MDDVRYIILPGDMRKDDRLTMGHLRIAMVLGAYSKRHGWTDLTQNDVGEMAGLSRQTVCTLVGELVEWGWVARRKKTGKNQYVYRFIMDREDCQLEATVPQKHCQPEPTGTVASDPTFNKEASSTISQSTLSAGAPATQSAARPALVKRGDNNWRRWINWLGAKGQHAAADAFEREGAMVVYSHEPNGMSPLPKLPPTNPAKLAELEADHVESLRKGYRDPTGEHAA